MARMMPRPSRTIPNMPSNNGTGDAPNVPAGVRVPKTNVDPVWSLCVWPVTVVTHGYTFTIEALPAVHWLKFMLNEQGAIDVLGLVTELVPDLEEFFYEEGLPISELSDLVLDIISTVGARPWWVTLRLVIVAAGSWQVLGPKMIAKGGDASKVSLAAWLDILLYQIMENIEPEKATMFDIQLTMPPRSEFALDDEPANGEIPVDTEMDARTFLSMAD